MEVLLMDLHKLRIFIDLSQTLNYTDTAENLFTTQGNISKQILSLEKELNVSLFERAHRKITLTKQGEITVPYAKNILKNYDDLQVKLNKLREEQQMMLELHTIPTMPSYQSFGMITKFLKKYPRISVQLKEEESYNLITSLKSGQCEMVFARTFGFDDSELERIVMEDDDFVAVLPKEHPCAQDKKINLIKLRQERFLILGRSTNLYTPVLELCRDAGFEPNIAYEGTRVDLIMQMVQNNMGISIMTSKTARNFDDKEFSFVPLTSNILNKLCFIRVKGEHSNANDLFWNYVQNVKSIGG